MLMTWKVQAEIIHMCLPSLMVLGLQERRVFLLKTPEDSFCHYASQASIALGTWLKKRYTGMPEIKQVNTGHGYDACTLNSNYQCMWSFLLKWLECSFSCVWVGCVVALDFLLNSEVVRCSKYRTSVSCFRVFPHAHSSFSHISDFFSQMQSFYISQFWPFSTSKFWVCISQFRIFFGILSSHLAILTFFFSHNCEFISYSSDFYKNLELWEINFWLFK